MRFGWILLVVLLLAQVDGQKRRKGDKKKDSQAAVEVTTTTAKPVEKRTRSTTTTTTTMIPTTLVEEDIDEEIVIVDVPISASNQCPPDLKEGSTNSSCICKDQLEDNAIMIECVALSSAQEMHKIFNVIIDRAFKDFFSNKFCFIDLAFREKDRRSRSEKFNSWTVGGFSYSSSLRWNDPDERK